MKRILMCGSALTEPGGMTSVCKQLVSHNWEDEFEIIYIPTHVSGTPFRKAGVFLSGVHQVRRELHSGNCSAAHIHMSYKGSFTRKYYISRLCKRYSRPYIVHMHGSEFKTYYESSTASNKEKITKMLEDAHTVIALGDDWKNYFEVIAPCANVVVLKNAVPFPGVIPRDRNGVFAVTFLGLLIKRKGVADLIDGFNSFVQSSFSDTHLYIAGSGRDEAALHAQVLRCGLEDKVSFLGWINEAERQELLSYSDAFVLPSYNEGLPVALLEAMAVGIPSVVADVGSVSEAVDDGVDGLLVKPGNSDQIADALTRLYESKNLWQSISNASMRKIGAEFDETCYFEKISDIYRLSISAGAAI